MSTTTQPPTTTPLITIRQATPTDVPLILDFIRILAEYEKAPERVHATETSLKETLFGLRPFAHVVFATWEGVGEVAMALWFYNYSTWESRPGIYLEDLIVKEEYRHKGIGTILLRYLATRAVSENCARFEWAALDWNTPAINFYRQVGAKSLDEWISFRLEGPELMNFANDQAGADQASR
ncbi:hypothetical protein HK097_005711 [Rhizophlyctis rosea]|uniref:N-acetyltransferase domain-containing protein n=1 Tax=Rhizophlyctis rosea TaxID=64517 RepID=A0AAD5SD92_9FUNG|nr:hypothetical protein HK097_005711 [Rhizophlyctis rosea]